VSGLLDGTTRQRGHANAARSAIVKERVLDALGQLGMRHGSHELSESAKEEFCRRAIRTAKEQGLRLWRSSSMTELQSARDSLATLLGEKKTYSRAGKFSTGVNSGWVLDIWEATLTKYSRTPLFEERPPTCRDEKAEYRLTDSDCEELNAGGPAFIHVARQTTVTKPDRPLSWRLMEAYIGRDDDAILQIAQEISSLEGTSPRA